ncbi:hypothetical protein VP01_1784g2 [Puccinia sorghi]|uniref:Uncharacterized protein n=1 Tax=Puccinia sorghi TaxID=27349 RepID=A0A0L6VEM5_9BASI|nr:hypothetical protein VP01_1784g2 [Puccinia sorghi]
MVLDLVPPQGTAGSQNSSSCSATPIHCRKLAGYLQVGSQPAPSNLFPPPQVTASSQRFSSAFTSPIRCRQPEGCLNPLPLAAYSGLHLLCRHNTLRGMPEASPLSLWHPNQCQTAHQLLAPPPFQHLFPKPYQPRNYLYCLPSLPAMAYCPLIFPTCSSSDIPSVICKIYCQCAHYQEEDSPQMRSKEEAGEGGERKMSKGQPEPLWSCTSSCPRLQPQIQCHDSIQVIHLMMFNLGNKSFFFLKPKCSPASLFLGVRGIFLGHGGRFLGFRCFLIGLIFWRHDSEKGNEEEGIINLGRKKHCKSNLLKCLQLTCRNSLEASLLCTFTGHVGISSQEFEADKGQS